MKIALAIRGLVRRPGYSSVDGDDSASVEWCLGNVQRIRDMFVNAGHEVDVFFSSWDVPNARNLSVALTASMNGYSKLLYQPTLDEAFEILPVEPVWFRDPTSCWHHTMTVYGTFAQSKGVMEAVRDSGKEFDYICATRPDIEFSVSDINDWIRPNTFVVPAVNFVNFNDHFGVAPAADMIKIYTPTDQELIEVVDKSLDTESVLKNLIEKNNVQIDTNININQYKIRDVDHLMMYKRDCGLL